jgi:hypothetical protein
MVPMKDSELINLLTEVVSVDHFGEDLYQRVFQALDAENEPNKLKTSIANALEEYHNYHNRRRIRLFGPSSNEPVPQEAEDEREELRLYIEALCQGITSFRSLSDLKSRLQTKAD